MGSERDPIRLPEKGFFRTVFLAGTVGVPAVSAMMVFAHFSGGNLTWELLTATGFGLVPLMLPVLAVYLSKAGWLAMRDTPESGIKKNVVFEAEPTPEVHVVEPPKRKEEIGKEPPHQFPSFPAIEALTADELRVLRTLWKGQKEYATKNKTGLWGFHVGPGSPHHNAFVRGYGNLSQRGLVFQEKTLVFLTGQGLMFCQLNDDHKLLLEGPAWTSFEPHE